MTPQTLFKCLGDETRLICSLLVFQEQELCVCELVEALGLSQPKISRHLAQLRREGLLIDRKQGQWVYYRLNPTLPSWAVNIIQQTHNTELDTLTPYTQSLSAMKGRPQRCEP
ncbi:metalloregulator ArsR/SmtB family transcription factor [Teredinibacter purpureus]|uniref:metalloregulator ArsR/SmtB family transcription factor n=1 Tax=Teredinibacter purpureus TaxID=2731756 RepID=UPI0005F8573E|nr:metalloregulator ArsR/SmtB family transcription factor [Teredinibacter purpureus]